MGIEEVLDLLEIDSPDQFEDFEHLAELLESGEEIRIEAFHALLRDIEGEVVAPLLDEYFEEILQGIPDDATDFYVLMTTIRQYLTTLAKESPGSDQRRLFIDELYRFRSWYAFDAVVRCTARHDRLDSEHTVAEALTLYRMEKLGEASYEYDYDGALEFPIEDLPLFLREADDAEPEESLEEEDAKGEDAYAETFIDDVHPVIDDEFTDEDETDDSQF